MSDFPTTQKEQWEILKRGATEIIPEKEFYAKLTAAVREKKPLRVKLGIDPTAPDIHLGHSVVLRKLRQFQECGHQVILIIGDFTAKIGDPSGRSEIRKVLTPEEIKRNTETYVNQIGKILDTKNSASFELRFNSEWLSSLTFQKMLELSHHFTVAQMLEREDFKKRYLEKKPIGLHEFFYPLLQGYDSAVVQADVELGGTDQTFNILAGRELQKIFGMESLQIAMLLPILEGTDGKEKMSKSLGNYIGITESPDEMFGKIMSIPDSLIARYFELLTDEPLETQSMKKNPREWKARLGEQIVQQYYGGEAAKKARENFDRVFREKLAPSDVPEFLVPEDLIEDGRISLVKLLVASRLSPSIREAKRLLAQGGVEIEGKRVSEEMFSSRIDGIILQAGKKRFLRLRFPGDL